MNCKQIDDIENKNKRGKLASVISNLNETTTGIKINGKEISLPISIQIDKYGGMTGMIINSSEWNDTGFILLLLVVVGPPIKTVVCTSINNTAG